MALVVKDRTQETSTTTGTGTFTLAGAVSGFQSFSVIGDGNTTYYAIVGGTEFEVGIGTYTALGTVLSRDTILESSNGGTAVNFSAGTKNVFVTYPAEKGLYLDASGNAIALGTLASATLTNATGLPLTTGVTGTLPIANGGTGTTSTTFTNLTTNVTGTLPVANGGTGTSTAFTTGSVVFAGASGTYTQDNTNFFWNDTNNRLGIGTASPSYTLDVTGVARLGSGVTQIAPSATDIASTSHTILSTTGGNGLFFGQYPSGTSYAQWIQSSFTNPTTATYNLILQPLGGNVGIGTTSPDALLTVNTIASFGDGAVGTPSIAHKGNLNTGLWFPAADTIAASTGGTERMRIDSTGNVLVAKAARGTITTDNDLSFDMNVASNFKCTPTALGTLTFTNITSGQSGFVLLVNTGGYAISAAATTEVSTTTLTTISTAGTYLLSYFSDGTNVFVTNSGALA